MGFAQMIGFIFVFCLKNILNNMFFSSEYFFRSNGRVLDFIIFIFTVHPTLNLILLLGEIHEVITGAPDVILQ